MEVDILINKAGIQFCKPLIELESKDWQRVMDTNLPSASVVGKQAATRMIAYGRGQRISRLIGTTVAGCVPVTGDAPSSRGLLSAIEISTMRTQAWQLRGTFINNKV